MAGRQTGLAALLIHAEEVMRISERGRITIPKALRERFGLDGNVEVEITPTENGLLICKRSHGERPVDRTGGVPGKDALGKGVGVDDYVEETRGAGERPVDRVYGILGKDALGEGVSVDDYIEEIRGR